MNTARGEAGIYGFEVECYGGAAAHCEARGLLSARERATLGTARPVERAAAILAGRRAVLKVLIRAAECGRWPGELPGLGEIEVLRREHRAPLVRVRGLDRGVGLSQAHADGLAAAAAWLAAGRR